MSDKVYDIPDYVISYCYKCQSKTGKTHNGLMRKYLTPELETWFSKQIYQNKNIIFGFIKQGRTSYTQICCKNCGKPLSEKQILKGQEFCSYSCSGTYTTQQEDTRQKRENTCLKKYGVKNPQQSEEVKEKTKQTNFKKFGVENPLQSKEVQEKRKQTNLKRYGVAHPYQSEEIRKKGEQTTFKRYGVKHALQSETIRNKFKETSRNNFGVDNPSQNDVVKSKRKNTFLEKYGVENPFQSKEVQEKIKQTNLERFGVENPAQSKEIQEKIVKTNFEKFGVENPSQSKEVREKINETNLKKFGVEHPAQSKEVQEKGTQTNLERYGTKWYTQSETAQKKHRNNYWDKFNSLLSSKCIEPVFSKEDYVHANGDALQFKCTVCGSIFETSDLNIQHIHCPHCFNAPYSKKEKEVLAFVQTIYTGTIIENDRTQLEGKELDIYLPELNLAIEFNGNYWHSLAYKESGVHQQKSLECKERGIRLIHIFEYEWDGKKDKIKNLLKNALGIFERTIYARDTSIKEIDNKTYKSFLTKYHLQGEVNSKYRLGLFDSSNELVSVLGIGASRFTHEIELHRFCSKFGVRVVGGFSKLLKHATTIFGINELISYIDFAHFSGKGYRTVGFIESNITVPNYVYVKNGVVISRYHAQKKFLPKLLGKGFHANLTEKENMFVNGYYCIEDAGNLKMLYTATPN